MSLDFTVDLIVISARIVLYSKLLHSL